MIHSHSIDHQKRTCVGGGGSGCRGGVEKDSGVGRRG
jgi:hypothetical protein